MEQPSIIGDHVRASEGTQCWSLIRRNQPSCLIYDTDDARPSDTEVAGGQEAVEREKRRPWRSEHTAESRVTSPPKAWLWVIKRINGHGCRK